MLNPDAPAFEHRRPKAIFFSPRRVHYSPRSSFPVCFPSPLLFPFPGNHPLCRTYHCEQYILPPSLYSDSSTAFPGPNGLLSPPPPPAELDENKIFLQKKVLHQSSPLVGRTCLDGKDRQPSIGEKTPSVRRRFLFRRKKSSVIWVPKPPAASPNQNPSSEASPEFGNGNQTTVMIKNIPNRITREMLISFLDQHCAEENEKEKSSSCPHPIFSEYDFVYLPIDFRHRCNLGYGFVNFTSPVAASRFSDKYQNYKWQICDSKKVCAVSSARVQGKEALVARFKNSRFKCWSDDYLPVQFDRPRNGSSSLPVPAVVGSRRPPE